MRNFFSAVQRLTNRPRNRIDLGSILRRFQSKSVSSTGLSGGLHQDGILSDTLIATPAGWHTVASLFKGDEVLTFDHGRQKIVAHQTIRIRRDTIPDCKAHTIAIPAGVFGNHRDIHLMPDQEILIESDEAEELFGDPFVLIPAAMLEGFKDVHKAPVASDLTLSVLTFEREEILYCNGGLLCLGRSDNQRMTEVAQDDMTALEYPRLSKAQLQALMVTKRKRQTLRPAFAGQSVEETYAAIEARLA